MSEYVTIPEAGKITGLGREWLLKLYRAGRIPGAARIAREVLVPRAWAEAEARRRADTVTLSEAAELSGVPKYVLSAEARAGRIARSGHGRLDKASLQTYIAEREEQ